MTGGSTDEEVRAFIELYARDLARTAMALTGHAADAQDLVQIACLQLWRSWSRVQDAADPAAYAHRILINAHVSERRRRHWREELPRPIVPDVAQDVGLAGIEAADTVRQVLDRLTPRQRAAVVCRFLLDYDDATTAAVLGCSVVTVRSQISRALAHLREHAMEVSDGT